MNRLSKSGVGPWYFLFITNGRNSKNVLLQRDEYCNIDALYKLLKKNTK